MDTDKPPLQAIFTGLQGSWDLKRTLASHLPTFPSGTFTGTATLTTNSSSDADPSYLYHERGWLRTTAGLSLEGSRKYIYTFSPSDAKICIWFVKDEGGEDVVDYLYHELEFAFEGRRWVARADHLCDRDMYWAFYDFRLEDEKVAFWGVKHKVKGPEKDYETDTVYTKQA